jgi:hypothetical protein
MIKKDQESNGGNGDAGILSAILAKGIVDDNDRVLA